jgi:hypothetical protein
MVMWWYSNLEGGRQINGRVWPSYQIWHPTECGILAEIVALNRGLNLKSFTKSEIHFQEDGF